MKEETLGMQRVVLSFNTTGNDNVTEIKQLGADLIDKLESLRNESNGREISLAQTQIETGVMYGVKSLFK